METIYLHTIPQPRTCEKVVELRAYQERKALLLHGTALPEATAQSVLTPLPEITPELPEPSENALERFLLWADAVASVVLILGALLVLTSVL